MKSRDKDSGSGVYARDDTMGTVSEFRPRRPGAKSPAANRGRFVTCAHCGERHPVIRLAGGTQRCVTAFPDERNWFCRNRGCRAAWLKRTQRTD